MDTALVLDAAAAGWVVAQVPHDRRVVRSRRLTGGLTSEVLRHVLRRLG